MFIVSFFTITSLFGSSSESGYCLSLEGCKLMHQDSMGQVIHQEDTLSRLEDSLANTRLKNIR